MESGSRLKRSLSEADLSSCTTVSCQDLRGFCAKDGWISKLDTGTRAENRKCLYSCGGLYSEEKITSDAIDIGRLELKSSVCLEAEEMEDSITCQNTFSANVEFSDPQNDRPLKQVNETVLGPVTPNPVRKCLQNSSPPDLVLGFHTPVKHIFDPFVPGPEDLMFAPKKKKMMLKGSRLPIQRPLNFDSCDTLGSFEDNALGDAMEEDCFLEMVYRSLDVIVPNQVVEYSGESSLAKASLCDGFETPTSLPFLTGIAETCPGAPVKLTSKSRKVGSRICRKLEF